MDKKLFRKTEGSLYGYYKDKNRLNSVRKEINTVTELNMCKNKAYNLREELVKNIAEYRWC